MTFNKVLKCCQISSALTIVRFEPLSLPADGPPPRAAATGDQRSRVAASSTSPCSRVSPWRRGGLPSGDPTALPALSLRAEGTEALSRPPCTGWVWEASFPSVVVVVGDEGNPTRFVTLASFNPGAEPLVHCLSSPPCQN